MVCNQEQGVLRTRQGRPLLLALLLLASGTVQAARPVAAAPARGEPARAAERGKARAARAPARTPAQVQPRARPPAKSQDAAARPPAGPATPARRDVPAELARLLNANQVAAALALARKVQDPAQLRPGLRLALAEALLAGGSQQRQQGMALLRTLLSDPAADASRGDGAQAKLAVLPTASPAQQAARPTGAGAAPPDGTPAAPLAPPADEPPRRSGEAPPAAAPDPIPARTDPFVAAPASDPGAAPQEHAQPCGANGAPPAAAAAQAPPAPAAEPPTTAAAGAPAAGADHGASAGPGAAPSPASSAPSGPHATAALPADPGPGALAPLARARLAEELARGGNDGEALALLEELQRAPGGETLVLRLAPLRARLLRAQARPEELLAFAGPVQPRLYLDEAKAELLDHRIWAARALGRSELAASLEDQLLRDHPRTPEAREVLKRQGPVRQLLHAVDHAPGKPPWFCQERKIEQLLAEAPVAEREAARAWLPYVRGMCLLRSKSHAAAQEQFDSVLADGPAPELEVRALLGRAVSLRRRDLDLEGAAAYRLLALRHPGHEAAPEALVEATKLHRITRETGLAELDVQLLQQNGAPAGLLPWARWTEAWLQLGDGRLAGAVRLLEELSRMEPAARGPSRGLSRGGLPEQALYWLARARADLGQQQEALDLWAALVDRYPLTYYSHLALAQIETLSPERAEALRRFPLLLGEGSVSAAALPLRPKPETAGAIALEQAGLPRLAIRELRHLLRAGRLEPEEVDHLAALYQEAGDYTMAYLTERFRGRFDRYPEQGSVARWLLSHPRPFRQLVERHAAAERIDPMLVWAIMRQESAFSPGVRSPAGAIGLMQLMPGTARNVARSLGMRRPKEQELYGPERNIQLACRLLRQLLDRYAGNVMYVLAAYNAGPGNVRRWHARWGMMDNDRWAEEIPIAEAHGYVKQVIESLGVYHHLYGRPEGSSATRPLLSRNLTKPSTGGATGQTDPLAAL